MTTYVGAKPDSVRSYALLPQKNYLINPTFNVNQRAFAGGALASAYGFDRWRSNDASGLTVTLPTAGEITIAGATTGLQQRVEDFGYRGEVTLSWKGTALATYYESNGQVVTTPATSPITFTLGDPVTLTNVVEYVGFGNGTVSEVKLEIGSVQTPFEYPDPGTELAKCQRFYEVCYTSIRCTPQNLVAGAHIAFRVAKRASPTMAFVANGLTTVNAAFSSFFGTTVEGSGVQYTSNGATDSSTFYGYSTKFTASAEL